MKTKNRKKLPPVPASPFCSLQGNVIAAAALCQLLGVALPQLSRLQAKGIVFRQSQGKYLFEESVANYFAYKSAPQALTYDEALKRAEAEGLADPVAEARSWSTWKIDPSDDIETVRRRNQPFDVAEQIFEFQTTLREFRLNYAGGRYVPENWNTAAEEAFQLLNRHGMGATKFATYIEHLAAWDAAWTPKQDKRVQRESGDPMQAARVAAEVVWQEERAMRKA